MSLIHQFDTDAGIGGPGHSLHCQVKNAIGFGLCPCGNMESQRTVIIYANII